APVVAAGAMGVAVAAGAAVAVGPVCVESVAAGVGLASAIAVEPDVLPEVSMLPTTGVAGVLNVNRSTRARAVVTSATIPRRGNMRVLLEEWRGWARCSRRFLRPA